MFSKQTLIVLLVGFNLLLAAALIVASQPPNQAFAQPGGRGAGYVCVTATVSGQSYDALFLLDQGRRKLHAFYPSVGTGELRYAGFRDLQDDFRADAKP